LPGIVHFLQFGSQATTQTITGISLKLKLPGLLNHVVQIRLISTIRRRYSLGSMKKTIKMTKRREVELKFLCYTTVLD